MRGTFAHEECWRQETYLYAIHPEGITRGLLLEG